LREEAYCKGYASFFCESFAENILQRIENYSKYIANCFVGKLMVQVCGRQVKNAKNL